MDRAPTPDAAGIRKALLRIHAEVRARLSAAEMDGVVESRPNPKGDLPYPFDLVADEVVRSVLEAGFGSGIVFSEESAPVRFGPGEPRWRFVVDPVDGSDNWSRRLPFSAVNVAVLSPLGSLDPEQVHWALVGPLDEEVALIAGRGEGALQGRRRLRASSVYRLDEALLSCELNHFAPGPNFGEVLRRARGVRSYGCASQALVRVASGSLDAYVDVRGRLTPESFLAAALVLEEAGGVVVGPDGRPVRGIESLAERRSLIAAATRGLAEEIIDVLSSSSR